jgi:hypothetical protein
MNLAARLLTVVLCGALAGPPAAFAEEMLSLPDNFVPTPTAVAQSNAFALGAEISDPLLDGWQHEGFKILIDETGQYGPNYSSSLCIDRTRDPILRQTIRQAVLSFGKLQPKEQAVELTKFAHALFTKSGLSDDQLSDWDDSFGNQHRGERILIGQYIRLGKGVCEQQAVLLKVLADELGLKAKLLFGFDNHTGHVWNTISIAGKDLVFDPAQEILGTTAGDEPTHKTIRQLYGDEFETLSKLEAARRYVAGKNFPEAEAALKQLADLDRRKLGASHPVFAISLERIADLYRLEEQEAKAEPYLRKALQVYRSAWGENHQQVADALNQLANLERGLDKERNAERLYKQAIRIYERSLGKEDTAVADPLFNLAQLYFDAGQSERAKPLFQRALLIYESNKGSQHQDTIDARAKLDELTGHTASQALQ